MSSPSNAWTTPADIVISCARGLAAHAAREAIGLGYEIVDTGETTVTVRGTLVDAMRLNLWLRSAHRVLWPLATARARRLDDLYAAASNVPWEEWLAPDGYFTVNAAVWNESVRDTRMPSLRTKDAIADRMRQKCGQRPNAGGEFHGAAVFVFWRDDDLRLYLDTTGEPLSKRGYRKLPWKAPMQETLAAACILATGWDGTTPFVSPMCGSGTPAIEAALIAMRRAPGIFREHFCFQSLKGFEDAAVKGVWEKMTAEARSNERTTGLPPIIASDLNAGAVDVARRNASVAGVAEMITFDVCDFAATALPPSPGVIFMNPEYGERMGDAAQLAPLYNRIGDFFKQSCAGYKGYVLTGNMELSRKIGLRSSRRLIFFNGPIECRLVEFDLYAGTQRKKAEGENMSERPIKA